MGVVAAYRESSVLLRESRINRHIEERSIRTEVVLTSSRRV